MKLTEQEIRSNQLRPDSLAAAVQQVKANGYILFESVIEPGFLDELRDAYMALFDRYMLNPAPRPTYNHHRLDLPFRHPFSDERVVSHPLAMPVVDALLGADCICPYFASNTCLPGSHYQPVHSDVATLFPEAGLAPPAYHVVVNIALMDTTEENGPMEMWPGGTQYSTLPPEEIEQASAAMHSEHAVMPAGSLLIRDGRMWHRGTINHSNGARANIALVYVRPWLGLRHRRLIGIPQQTYDGLSPRAQQLFRFAGIGQPVNDDLLA